MLATIIVRPYRELPGLIGANFHQQQKAIMTLAKAFNLNTSKDGNIILYFQHPDFPEGVELTPDLFAHLIRNGIQLIINATSGDVRAHSQMVGIRDISAGTPHPSLVSLKYTLECGPELETSIDLDSARKLRDGLSAAIQMVEAHPPQQIQ